ncbi:MAG: DUF5684 domain-containing protein [Myxococcales bacterium]
MIASSLLALAQAEGDGGGAAGGVGGLLVQVVLTVLMIAALWKVFTKAGEPGWAAIVPIYNFFVMLKIAGKPAWWIVLMFIPIANFIVLILVAMSIAKNFNKSGGFGIGLALLPIVFYPLLAFGDAQFSPQR